MTMTYREILNEARLALLRGNRGVALSTRWGLAVLESEHDPGTGAFWYRLIGPAVPSDASRWMEAHETLGALPGWEIAR